MTDGHNSLYGGLCLCDLDRVLGAGEAPSIPAGSAGLQTLAPPCQASSQGPLITGHSYATDPYYDFSKLDMKGP